MDNSYLSHGGVLWSISMQGSHQYLVTSANLKFQKLKSINKQQDPLWSSTNKLAGADGVVVLRRAEEEAFGLAEHGAEGLERP